MVSAAGRSFAKLRPAGEGLLTSFNFKYTNCMPQLVAQKQADVAGTECANESAESALDPSMTVDHALRHRC